MHPIAGLVLVAITTGPLPQASGAVPPEGKVSRAAALLGEGMDLLKESRVAAMRRLAPALVPSDAR